MSYYAHTIRSDFILPHEHEEEAFQAVLDQIKSACTAEDLTDVFSDFGFYVERNCSGHLVDPFYDDKKFYCDDCEELLNAIAPFVAKGSYIAFAGEDDTFWAYYFDGRQMLPFNGDVDFPFMPMDGPKKSLS